MAPGYYRSRARNSSRPAVAYKGSCNAVRCVVCYRSCPPHNRSSLPSSAQQPMFCRYPAAGRAGRLVCCHACHKRIREWIVLCASYPPSQLPPVVLPSLIPGARNGLFATRPYRAREFIASFSGVLLKTEHLPAPSQREYLLQVRNDLYLDSRYLCSVAGSSSGAALGRYANQAPSGQCGNSRLVVCHKPIRAGLRCRGQISAGEEITTHYGWSGNTKQERGVK
jgi:hypothetical protein